MAWRTVEMPGARTACSIRVQEARSIRLLSGRPFNGRLPEGSQLCRFVEAWRITDVATSNATRAPCGWIRPGIWIGSRAQLSIV